MRRTFVQPSQRTRPPLSQPRSSPPTSRNIETLCQIPSLASPLRCLLAGWTLVSKKSFVNFSGFPNPAFCTALGFESCPQVRVDIHRELCRRVLHDATRCYRKAAALRRRSRSLDRRSIFETRRRRRRRSHHRAPIRSQHHRGPPPPPPRDVYTKEREREREREDRRMDDRRRRSTRVVAGGLPVRCCCCCLLRLPLEKRVPSKFSIQKNLNAKWHVPRLAL